MGKKALLFLFCILLVSCGKDNAPSPDDAVARVNNAYLTRAEVIVGGGVCGLRTWGKGWK